MGPLYLPTADTATAVKSTEASNTAKTNATTAESTNTSSNDQTSNTTDNNTDENKQRGQGNTALSSTHDQSGVNDVQAKQDIKGAEDQQDQQD